MDVNNDTTLLKKLLLQPEKEKKEVIQEQTRLSLNKSIPCLKKTTRAAYLRTKVHSRKMSKVL